MFKRIVSATLVTMMLVGAMLVPAYAEGYHSTDHIVTFVPELPDNKTLPANSVLPGDAFTMAVNVKDEANVGFYSAEIIINYNKDLFYCERDLEHDGKIVERRFPSTNDDLAPSDWTTTSYNFEATSDDIPTTTGTFTVKANIIETAEDAWKPGDMSVSGSCDITIVNQFTVSYYDTEGNKITTAGTQTVINQDDNYIVPQLEKVAYHHLRWTIDDAEGTDYKTSAEVNAESPTADSHVYLHEIPNTYAITVEGNETANIETSYTYDGISDLVGTIDNYDPRYDYTVSYSIIDTPYPDGLTLFNTPEPITGEAAITNGKTFTVDAQYLKGPVVLTITKQRNVEIEVTEFVAGTGGPWYLIRVYGDAIGYTFNEAGSEKAMYSYAGYTNGAGKTSRVWLTQELAPHTANSDGVFAKLSVVDVGSNPIPVVENDLNQDGVINFKDATSVNAAYLVQWSNVQDNIARYIQADVTLDGVLNSQSSSDTNTVLNDSNYIE